MSLQNLKAANVLIDTTTGVCKMGGFGLSQEVREPSTEGLYGTLFWMAPEVLHPTEATPAFKADVWSLGCVMLEMWTQCRPWAGEEMIAVTRKLPELKHGPPLPETVQLTEMAEHFKNRCFAR